MYILERERERERELTCKTASYFAFLRGRDTEEGLMDSAQLAKSIEASPIRQDFDDPYKNRKGNTGITQTSHSAMKPRREIQWD